MLFVIAFVLIAAGLGGVGYALETDGDQLLVIMPAVFFVVVGVRLMRRADRRKDNARTGGTS